MNKKPQKQIIVNSTQYQKIKEELTKKKETLEQELSNYQNEYLNVATNSENLYKLKRLAKKERLTKTLIQKIIIDLIHLEEGTYIELNFLQKIIKRLKTLSYHEQKVACGILFVLPWFIGFCLFFAKPLFTTIYWSFNEVTPIAGGLEIKWVGLLNYKNLFTVQMLGQRTFLEVLTVSLKSMVLEVPVIFIFSLIIAVILNTKFKGHEIFKAIFFIPVVYNAAIISNVLSGSFGGFMSGAMDSFSGLLDSFSRYLLQIGLAEGLITFLINAVNTIFTIVNASGIQILIFIAALQSIPKHLYEAAKVEGATTYECFWKITFPMVSPMFLPLLVFSIVDSFAKSDLINYMTKDSGGSKIGYGMSSTIAIIYFGINLFIIGLLFSLLKKVVYSNEQ